VVGSVGRPSATVKRAVANVLWLILGAVPASTTRCPRLVRFDKFSPYSYNGPHSEHKRHKGNDSA